MCGNCQYKTQIYFYLVSSIYVGTVSSEELWLSCDHTFKSAANIGMFRSADGKWVKQYNGLFCVLNCAGEVLTWKFVKDLRFGSIEDQMTNLHAIIWVEYVFPYPKVMPFN